MSQLRWPLRAYLVAVVAAAGLAFVGAAFGGPTVDTPSGPLLFALLFLFAAAAQVRPLKLSMKIRIGVDDTPTFAAVLLFSPVNAMALCAGAMLVAKLVGHRTGWKRARWYEHAFNVSATALGAGAAAVCFRALAVDDSSVVANPLAVAASAIVLFMVRTGLVDVVAALQLRRDPIAWWWPLHRRDLTQHAALYLLGALAALAVATHPWAVVLFVAPVAIIYGSLREVMRLREQTRAAVFELADLVDLRDPYTHGHSQRVAEYAARLAQRLALSPSEVELVREAARMHDVGKIGTPDHVLQKPGPLTPSELLDMRAHAEYGARLLQRMPEFWEGATLVHAHHERWDGQGYPRRLGGSEIPIEASIIAVADAYDAMATDRPYRRAMPWPAIRSEFLRCRGSQWPTEVVDAFLELMEPQVQIGRAETVPAT